MAYLKKMAPKMLKHYPNLGSSPLESCIQVRLHDFKKSLECQYLFFFLNSRFFIHPGNFNIQYEAYSMMKDEENANDAAKAFQELFKEFVGKSKSVEKLWSELDEMIEILATPGRENSFLHLIFDKMDSTTQREILLSSSARAKDPLIRIKRILIAFQKFPDLIPKHGMDNCLGYILNLCKSRVRQQAVVDDLLELLLTEVAPLLVPVPSLEIEYNALNDLLLLTFEYIFAVLLHGQDKVNDISWSNLIHLFGEIGKRLQWSFSTVLLKPSQKDQNIYHHLVAFLQGKSTILNIGRLAEGIHEDIKGQVFYVGTLMFLKTLSDYLIYTQGLGNVNNPAILVEAFVTHEDSDNEPLAKRRRTTDEERRIPDVTHHGDGGGGVGGPDQPLVNGFLNAVRYYELLASDPDLINRLQRQVHPPDNLIYPFIADTYIYQGRFKEAFATLRHLPPPKLPIAQCQYFLKNASLYHATNNLQDMTDQTWQALAILSTLKSEHNHHENTNITKNTENVTIKDSRNPKASRNGKELTLPTSKMRHIHFLDFNRQSIICKNNLVRIFFKKGP